MMHSTPPPARTGPKLGPKRPGARPSSATLTVPINFYCTAPDAKEVFLIGEFNGWDPTANPLQKQVDGTWFLQLAVCHGHHHYMFLIDGKACLDPRATGVGRNEKNERVSLLAVS